MLDEGIDQLSDSLAVQRAIGAGLVRSAFLGVLADLLRFAGREDEALSAVSEGFAHAEQYRRGRLPGGTAPRGGTAPGQGGHRRRGGRICGGRRYAARGQQARSFELRAATGWAHADRAGRHADARAVLEPVYAWFTEGHTTMDMTAARNTLASLR